MKKIISKSCLLCGKNIVKHNHINDFSWSIKKYCNDECLVLSHFITKLEKKGFKVTKI